MMIRTTIPKNNKYYIRQATGGLNGAVQGYPTIATANVLCNCVGYANGRFNEIINDPNFKGINIKFRYQLVCNAENFIESAKKQGLKISSTPTVGGIMVWQKGKTLGGSDGAGHVAVVEEIYKDGSIFTSESGYGSRDWAFKNIRRNNSNGRWGQSSAYKFRGCIVNPSIGGGKPVDNPKLVVDGIGGVSTVMRMQEFFGTYQDGNISGQSKAQAKYFPSLKAVSYSGAKSTCIKSLQKWVGTTADGVLGQATVKAWQKKIGVKADGIFGTNSMKAWQKYLNEHDKPDTPTPTPTPTPTAKYKGIDVSEWQKTIDWKKVKADGVVCAIIRYADGDYLDPKFDYNMKNAKANGIHIGAYIFSRAKTKTQAEKEATRLFNACKPYNCDMPLYIDLEAKGLEKYATTVANAFLSKIKALGGYGGVYANLNWWNNHLKSVNPPSRWVAQYYKECSYKGSYGMWQYSSSGSVKGISGRVDMNWCYVDYWNKINPPTPTPTPTPTPDKKGYQGTFPSYRLTKNNAKVISDTCEWAKKIAANNDFHYGHGQAAHHNGCFYCGTQPKSKQKAGIKMWQTTYCCNPFVGAAWAHGGGDAQAYKMCHNGTSWDFHKGRGYDASKFFNKLGHPAKSKLQAGDVLCKDNHVALYIGGGKIAEASGGDDNVIHSKKWNGSISVKTLSDSRYKSFPRVYRYNGKVDCDRPLQYGELSDRVADMQKYLNWYGFKLSETSFFNKATLEAVIKFQEAELGKSQADGIVGPKTIDAMKKVKK